MPYLLRHLFGWRLLVQYPVTAFQKGDFKMVYILLAPGFEEAEALVPADLLRRAEISTALVSLDGNTVTGSHRITVSADLALSQVDLEQAEMVVLPGGGKGVENLWKDERVSALIQEAAKRNIWLAALCAAPTLLARWGLLDGRNAVSYPDRQGHLGEAHVLPEARTVVDGHFVTGHACGSSFDFGLKLVQVLRGEQAAQTVDRHVYYTHTC